MSSRVLALLALLAVALLPSDSRAFTIRTGFTDGCHEQFATDAFLRSLPELPAFPADAVPRDDWENVASVYLNVDEELDRGARFALYSVVLGARAPDTEGHSITNAQALRAAQSNPTGQYAHCLRARDDDYDAGNASALAGCREEILASVVRALDAVRAAEGDRHREVEEIVVTLDVYGAFETKVWLPAYHLGRALHTLQDSFSHMLRGPTMHSVVHVMNFEAAVAGRLDEARDGLAHSVTMDRCALPLDEGERALQAARYDATVNASAQLLQVASALLRADMEGTQPTLLLVEEALDTWLTLADPAALGDFEACTDDNDYCASPWLAIARRQPTTPAFACAAAPSPRAGTPQGVWLFGVLSAGCLVRRTRRRGSRARAGGTGR
ncbi:MAG: hypothetical protein KC593_03435 [Myxococcales bacterium]|nr:hypothetical protein [Myxococcales bacterium]